MLRHMLSDERWSKLREIMREFGIYDKPQLRMTVEGILHRMRTGCPWRDLPKEFGRWNTIYPQFNRWSAKNKCMGIFRALIQNPDLEWQMIDGTIVKAHQHSAGAAGQKDQAIGRSVAGNTTKIHMATDSFGLPLDFVLTGGEVHECSVASAFLDRLPMAEYVIADKGYDSEAIRFQIQNKSSTPVIPRKRNSRLGNSTLDRGLYRVRHLIENLFARLKHFRSIATRFDKLSRNYASMLAFACAFLWLPL